MFGSFFRRFHDSVCSMSSFVWFVGSFVPWLIVYSLVPGFHLLVGSIIACSLMPIFRSISRVFSFLRSMVSVFRSFVGSLFVCVSWFHVFPVCSLITMIAFVFRDSRSFHDFARSVNPCSCSFVRSSISFVRGQLPHNSRFVRESCFD